MRRKTCYGSGKKRCKQRGVKIVYIVYFLFAVLFLLYGLSPSDESGSYFGFRAFAYTCTISSITESSNYAYASGTNVYYTNLGTGTFTTNVNAALDAGDCEGWGSVYDISFPATVSAG